MLRHFLKGWLVGFIGGCVLLFGVVALAQFGGSGAWDSLQRFLNEAHTWTAQQTFSGGVAMPTANLGEYTVATLPAAAAANENYYTTVTDGSTTTDCTVGGGANRVLCRSTGAAWEAAAGGGGSATPGGDSYSVQLNNAGNLGGASMYQSPDGNVWVQDPNSGVTILQNVPGTNGVSVANLNVISVSTTPSDGNNKLTLSNNTAISPTAGTNEIYVEGNVFKLNQNGSEFSITQDNAVYDKLGAYFNNGSSPITAGTSVFVLVPFTCTLNSATILSKVSGSITIDVWKDTLANYPPTDDDHIGNTPFQLSTRTYTTDTAIGSGNTVFNKGDTLIFFVDAADTTNEASITLTVKR